MGASLGLLGGASAISEANAGDSSAGGSKETPSCGAQVCQSSASSSSPSVGRSARSRSCAPCAFFYWSDPGDSEAASPPRLPPAVVAAAAAGAGRREALPHRSASYSGSGSSGAAVRKAALEAAEGIVPRGHSASTVTHRHRRSIQRRPTFSRMTRDSNRIKQVAAFSPAIAHWELRQRDVAEFAAGGLQPRAWGFDAALLFVDISGFTNMCTRLDIDPLQQHINNYFTSLIDIIVRRGGDVLRFLGDALLCSWSLRASDESRCTAHDASGDASASRTPALELAVQTACACALELMQQCATYTIPELGATLSIHAGISAGPIHAFRVGTATRWEFLVAGPAVRQMYAAEGRAGRGEAVCAAEAWPMVAQVFDGEPRGDRGDMLLVATHPSPGSASYEWMSLGSPTSPVSIGTAGTASPNLLAECHVMNQELLLCSDLLYLQRFQQTSRLLRHERHLVPLTSYVHDVARTAIEENVLEVCAEQRQVIVTFAKVGGLDEALLAGEEGLPAVQRCIEAIQDILSRQGGILRQFILDDKGAVAIWTFGLPGSTYENNAHRGLRTALEVSQALEEQELTVNIGVTSGVAFCGRVGAPYRCEYSVMGPSVNLAARLMCACEREGDHCRVLCNGHLRDELAEREDRAFLFSEFPPVEVKGYSSLVTFYRVQLNALQKKSSHVRHITSMSSEDSESHGKVSMLCGRDAELKTLLGCVQGAIGGGTALTFVTGEHGIGKSCLLRELRKRLQSAGGDYVNVALVEAEKSLDDPLATWGGVLRILLGHEMELPEANLDLEAAALLLPPALSGFKGELGMLLDLGVLAGEHRLQLEQEIVLALISRLAASAPCAILIDAGENLSLEGWRVLQNLVSDVKNVAVVVAMRDLKAWRAENSEPLEYRSLLKSATSLELRPLTWEAIQLLLAEILGVDSIERDLAEVVHKWCGGNPLFLCSVAPHLALVSEDLQNETSPRRLYDVLFEALGKLPSSVNESVLAQLDRLRIQSQMILKTASALGSRFKRSVLLAAYPGPSSDFNNALFFSELQPYIVKVETTTNDVVYAFKNTAITEIIYKLMLSAQRQRIHFDIAQWYIRVCEQRLQEGLDIDDLAGVLAYHFSRSHDKNMTRLCVFASGCVAIRRGLYTEAERSLCRCRELLRNSERAEDRATLVEVLINIAELYSRYGLMPPAGTTPQGLLQDAMRIRQELDQEGFPDDLQLARIYHALSFHVAAALRQGYLEAAIRLRKGAGRPILAAESLNSLGQVYHDRGKALGLQSTEGSRALEQAEALILESIQIRAEQRGSSDLAQSKTSISSLYLDLKTPAEAAACFWEATRLYTITLGPFHSRISTALEGLAQAYERMGDIDCAIGVLSRKKVIRAHLGIKNPVYRSLVTRLEQLHSPERPWLQPASSSAPSDDVYAQALSFCASVLNGTAEDSTWRASFFKFYPELGFYKGLMFGNDLDLSPHTEQLRSDILASMELAASLARAAASSKGNAGRFSPDLVSFAAKYAAIDTASTLDELLIMLVISSLDRVAIVVEDANVIADEVADVRLSAVLESTALHLPSLARLPSAQRRRILHMLHASVNLTRLCNGECVPASLRPYANTALIVGDVAVWRLLIHDVLRAFGTDLLWPMQAEGAPELRAKKDASMAVLALECLRPLAEVSEEMGEQPVYRNFLRKALPGGANRGIAQSRLACLLHDFEGSCVADLDAAIAALGSRDWQELEAELCHDTTAASTHRPIVLYGSSDLLRNCLQVCAGSSKELRVETLTAALAVLGQSFRTVRDVMRSGAADDGPFEVNCVAVAQAVAMWGAGVLAEASPAIVRVQPRGAYLVLDAHSNREQISDQAGLVQHILTEKRNGHSDVARLAAQFCSSRFGSPAASGGGSQQACVMVASPALTQDAELALILSRSLIDIGVVEMCAVVANVQPAQARAKLARGTLDALGLEQVPVAVGTDGRSTGHEDDFTASVAATGVDYLVREPDACGQELLLKTYQEAAPGSLTLLLVSALTDAARFIGDHPDLFREKTSRVVIQGGVDKASLQGDEEFLCIDKTAQNLGWDLESSTFVFRRCQELGVRLVVLTRFAVYAAGMPAFIYDELATIGHPVALRLRENQIRSTTDLWHRCGLPDGHPDRKRLPGRCDRAWFAKQVCGGADLSTLPADAAIWPYVTTTAIYDPLCLLATQPEALARFFQVEIKVVRGVEHMVIGVDEEHHGIRDVPGLKSFMLSALRYALSQPTDAHDAVRKVPSDRLARSPLAVSTRSLSAAGAGAVVGPAREVTGSLWAAVSSGGSNGNAGTQTPTCSPILPESTLRRSSASAGPTALEPRCEEELDVRCVEAT